MTTNSFDDSNDIETTLLSLEIESKISRIEAEFCTYLNFTIDKQNTRNTGEIELISNSRTDNNTQYIIVIPDNAFAPMLISTDTEDGAIKEHHGAITDLKV